MSRRNLRSAEEKRLVGAKEFSDLVLPTVWDVMRQYYFEHARLLSTSGENPPSSTVAKSTAEKVLKIWQKASLPVLSLQRVVTKICAKINECRDLEKLRKRHSPFQRAKEEAFKNAAQSTLFDICTCKRPDPQEECKCEKSRKVPVQEIKFLLDQRNNRKMVIGGVDVGTTSRLRKRQSREERQSNPGVRRRARSDSGLRVRNKRLRKEASSSEENAKSSSNDTGTGTDSDFEPQQSKSGQNRLSLRKTDSVAYRTGVSRRHVAMIASAALEDAGVVTSGNTECVVDKSKVARGMRSLQKTLQEEECGKKLLL